MKLDSVPDPCGLDLHEQRSKLWLPRYTETTIGTYTLIGRMVEIKIRAGDGFIGEDVAIAGVPYE